MKSLLILIFLSCVLAAPILPNIQYMQAGYNTLKGQPVMEALMLPVWNFTWNSGKIFTWYGQNYSIPDQLLIVPDPEADSTSYNQIFMTSYDIQTTLSSSFSVGFDPFFMPGMFSYSQQTTNFQEHYYQYDEFTAFSNLRVKTWKATIAPGTSPLASFMTDLMNLPDTYNSATCSQFKGFFNKYGTHTFSNIVFGGTVSMSTSFSMEIIKTKTITQIQQDLNTQFFLMTYNSQLTYQQEQELSTLNATYSSTFQLVGGTPGAFNQTQWQIWANTVQNNPVFIQFELVPLWQFLPTYKTQALQNATQAYLLSKSDYWQVLDENPLTNMYLSSTSNDEYIYVIDTYQFYAYNLRKNTWHSLISPPQFGDYMGMAVVNNQVYIVGGIKPLQTASGLFNTVYRYDLASNTWATLPPLPASLCGMNMINLSDGFLMIGGFYEYDWEFFGSINEVAVYNTTLNKWYQVTLMPTPRAWSASVLYNGIIYIFGGANYQYNSYPPAIAQVDAFNLATNTWSIPTIMPRPRMFSSAVVLNNLIYIIGGISDDYIGNQVDIYNPATNTWTVGPAMNVPKMNPAVATLSTGIYSIFAKATEVIVTHSFC